MHLRVCAAGLSVDPDCRLSLHSIGDMTINVECGLGADVSYHGGERFNIHSVFECHGRKGVSQIVKAHLFTAFFLCKPYSFLFVLSGILLCLSYIDTLLFLLLYFGGGIVSSFIILHQIGIFMQLDEVHTNFIFNLFKA